MGKKRDIIIIEAVKERGRGTNKSESEGGKGKD